MTIVQLEYLIAVDTYKSFADAAQKTYVTQPALSMQIKKIEGELGILIFDRSKKPIVTTEIGKQIVKQAQETVRQARKIYKIIERERDEISGTLRIGIIPTLSPYLLPLFITKFMDAYPNVSLVIEELLSKQILYKLDNDMIDLGILVTPVKKSNLVKTPLFYEPFTVYASSKHPFSKKEEIEPHNLKMKDMWLLNEGHCLRSQMLNVCGKARDEYAYRLKFESGSLETIKRIVKDHYGYTLLPKLATLDMTKEQLKLVKPFTVPQPVREVSILTHQSFMKQELINAFKQEVLNNIPTELHKNKGGWVIEWE